jgi:hypothetical protein
MGTITQKSALNVCFMIYIYIYIYISYSPVYQARILPGVNVQNSRVCVLLGDFSFQNIAQYLNANNDIIAIVCIAH